MSWATPELPVWCWQSMAACAPEQTCWWQNRFCSNSLPVATHPQSLIRPPLILGFEPVERFSENNGSLQCPPDYWSLVALYSILAIGHVVLHDNEYWSLHAIIRCSWHAPMYLSDDNFFAFFCENFRSFYCVLFCTSFVWKCLCLLCERVFWVLFCILFVLSETK